MNATTEIQFKELLQQFNKGIKAVKIDLGIIGVCVRSKKAVMGVMTDLCRSRAFSSVTCGVDNIDGGFVVYGVIKGT